MKIENEKSFATAIDRLGQVTATIDDLKTEAKLLKLALELYAHETGTKRHDTAKFRFAMQKGEIALRRRPGLTDADVARMLKTRETMRPFVYETFDSDALKAYAKTLGRDADETLAEVGLYLTEPKPHATITVLG